MNTTATEARVETRALSDYIGGEIVTPVDLNSDLPDDVIRQIEAALYRHQVLVIPNQKFDPAGYVRFAARIGRPEPHVNTKFRHPAQPEILILSNVKKDGQPTGLGDAGSHWHTDFSYLAVPAKATMLWSIQVPKVGGNTLFCSMYQAYEGLSASLKKQADKLQVVHSYATRISKNDDPVALAAIMSTPNHEAIPNVVHPLVVSHPVTRRKTLYSPAGTAYSIVGMPQDESDDFLDELKLHATQPAYRYSQDYRVGDLVIWDNPSLMHAATMTAPEYARTLHRITVMMDANDPWRTGAGSH